jgi:hypothetical protein
MMLFDVFLLQSKRKEIVGVLPILLLLIFLFFFGCTGSPDTIIINARGLDYNSDTNTVIVKDNLLVSKDLFSKMPHMFGIADTIQTPRVVGEWQAIDFNFNIGDNYGFGSQDSNCLVVQKTGHYMVNLEGHFSDSAANPNSVVGLRISINGVESSGSYSAISLFKQDAEQEITTFGYVIVDVNDVICMDWVTDSSTVSLNVIDTYATKDISAKGFINWVHN